MKKRSDRETRADDSREKIIGLGDSSARKSYYPQLQRRLRELKEEIVERQRVEDELRESQDLLRTVMNSAQDAMIAINEQALITTFNAAAEKMFGRSEEEVLGRPLDQLMPEEFRQRHREYVTSYFATGKPDSAIGKVVELPGLRRDGTVFPMEISLAPGVFGGKKFVISIARDITQRKRAEEEREKLLEAQTELDRARREHMMAMTHAARLAAMGEMMAVMAHELNQPLGSIRNYLSGSIEAALSGGDDGVDTVVAGLKRIEQLVDRATNVIRRLREFSRPDSGAVELVKIDEIVSFVADLFQPRLQRLGIELKISIPGDLPSIEGHPLRLEQVLLNLLMNACDAVEKTDIKVIEIKAAKTGEEKLSLSVADTGVGVSDEIHDKIFEAFYTTKPWESGQGLGLSISRSIIREHGGTLTVRNLAAGGVVFTFTLPLAPAEVGV